MPYIKDYTRTCFNGIRHVVPVNPGQLNFVVTKLVHAYIKRHGLYYKHINEAIGALECAKLELYRMVAAPYEDKKRKNNGPISDLDSLNLEDVR